MEDKRFELITTQRHLRVIFFIPNGCENSNLANLFIKNLYLWGGRYNPIIPVEKDGQLLPEWAGILPYLDPDYVLYAPSLNLEHIKAVCLTAGLNPIEINVLDERYDNIPGTYCSRLQSLLPYIQSFFKLIKADSLQSPLKEYYRINHMIDSTTSLPYVPNNRYRQVLIDSNQSDKIHELIVTQRIEGLKWLPQLHLTTQILRAKKFESDSFEIIIAKDLNSFDDFIYYWNLALYRNNHFLINHLIITQEQLDVLVRDPYFGEFLDLQNVRQNPVKVTSRSVGEEALNIIQTQLQAITKSCHFKTKVIKNFPFEVENTSSPTRPAEQPFVDAGYNKGHLFHIPSLSFSGEKIHESEHWIMDIVIRVNDRKNYIKYPYTARAQWGPSRINSFRDTSLLLNSRTARLEVSLPSDYSVIRQLIESPHFLNEKGSPYLFEVGYSDSSNKLREFIKLFDNQFHYFQAFFYDRFWHEWFYDLSTNTRVEGDCFSLTMLFDSCLSLIQDSGIELKDKKESRYNLENLRLGLTDTIQELCEQKVLRAGYILKCEHCSSKTWYSISETSNQVTCKGCSNLNYFQAETPIAYKLNSLIKNNIAEKDKSGEIKPDGNLTVIKTLSYFSNFSRDNFMYTPQLNVYEMAGSFELISDIDLICLVDGRLHIGECKNNSDAFAVDGHKSINSLLMVAEKIRPEVLVLSCTENPNKRLEKAKQYIEGKIYSWPFKPEILIHQTYTPDKYMFEGHRFWRH